MQVVLVFITKAYNDKVARDDDNCAMEFAYAKTQKGSTKLVPVVMEPCMVSQQNWTGPLGLALGSHLYYKFCNDTDLVKCVEAVSVLLNKALGRAVADDGAGSAAEAASVSVFVCGLLCLYFIACWCSCEKSSFLLLLLSLCFFLSFPSPKQVKFCVA